MGGPHPIDPGRPTRWVSAGLGGYALAGGLVALLGWALDLPRLTDWDGTGISQMPNSAVAMSAAGAGLVLIALGRRRAGAALGGLAALIGAATLLQYVTGLDLGIDRLLVFREWGQRGTVVPGRMGPPGATSLTVIGASLVLLGFPRTRRWAVAGGLLTAGIASLSIVGHLFKADTLYTIPKLTTIALQTATMLMALGLGLVAAVPDAQPVRLLLERSAATPLVRRAWPAMVGLTVGVAFVLVRGQQAGHFDPAFESAVLVLVLLAAFTALLWWAAATIAAHERADRASRDRLVGVLESVTDAVTVVDADWRCVYGNQELGRRLGKAPGDLPGQPVWDLAPDVGGVASAALRRAMGERVGVEYELFDEPSGRWFAAKAYPTTDGGLAVFSRDVTDRRQVEDRLRESEAVFRTLGEALPDFLWMSDAVGRPIYQNPAWRAYTGLTHDDLLRDGWQSMPHPDDLARLQAVWDEAVRLGRPFEVEYRCRRHDGAYRWFLSRTVPIRDAAGRVVKWVGTTTDIHDRRQAEEALKDADRRKDEFLATLAHELRNPLAPIRNSLEVLKQAAGDPDLLARVRATMERQLAQMVRLIDDLLDVSRITRDKLELRPERVELASVLHQAVEACGPLVRAADHRLTVTVPPEPVYLHADPVRLAQVFGNLLTNACKYTGPGGHVDLAAERRGSDVVVTVRDTGIGIPADMLPRVFDMFTQGDRTLERAQGGLGIGLTLVNRLVELHGGSVTAHSAGPGRGSEFAVRLPVVPDAELDVPTDTATPLRTPGFAGRVRKRVLVVDDNRDAATSLALLLELTGHAVETAFDGEEAVAKATASRPDVILLDIGLPKLNGYDACRAIREQPWAAGVVMVALTGWGQEEDRRKSRAAGFDRHLVKPVDHAALQELLVANGRAEVVAPDNA